jgi:hypothetical protein
MASEFIAIVRSLDDRQSMEVHISRVRKYLDGDRNLEQDLIEITREEDGMFEIEDIIGYKLVEGQEWVKIKWKGFEMEQSSWEPADYIEGIAPALVQKARMLGKGGVLGQIRPNTNYGPNLPQGTGIRNISSPSL